MINASHSMHALIYSRKLLSIRIYWNKFPVLFTRNTFGCAAAVLLPLMASRRAKLEPNRTIRSYGMKILFEFKERNYILEQQNACTCIAMRERLNNIWLMCATYSFLINLSFRLSSILNCYCCDFDLLVWPIVVCLCPLRRIMCVSACASAPSLWFVRWVERFFFVFHFSFSFGLLFFPLIHKCVMCVLRWCCCAGKSYDLL